MKCAISGRCLANPIHAPSHLPQFLKLTWISYSLSNWRFSCSLRGHIGGPTIMWTFGPGVVSIFWPHSPISFKHMSFWYLLRSTPNHIPLKNRCPYPCYVGIRYIYLIATNNRSVEKLTYGFITPRSRVQTLPTKFNFQYWRPPKPVLSYLNYFIRGQTWKNGLEAV